MGLLRAFDGRPMTVAQKLHRVHWPLLAVVGVIAGTGVVLLYSVAGGSFAPWADRHALRLVGGLALVLVLATVTPRVWLGLAYPLYAVALGLLALVPLAGVEALGARRWLAVAGTTFQPSEAMKIALVLALARYYHWLAPARRSHPLGVLPALAMIALPVALTLKQPDLGTAVLFAGAGGALMFLGGVHPLYFAGGAAGAIAAAPLVLHGLHGYQRRRLEVFLDPGRDPLGAGYHITQSKIAIGSGGVSGKGFLEGSQAQLDFLPEKHTDFIFTSLAEELGFVGSMSLLALYVLLIAMLLAMALRCRNAFGRLMIAGVAVIFFVYAVINVAMVTGLAPVVGVPLPLVSYGGTAMITLMIGLGIAMSAYVHRDEIVRREDLGPLL